MSLEVETGEGLALAESYVSRDMVAAYAKSRGRVWIPESDDLADAACRVGSAWVDANYRARFPGFKRRGRAQGLEWPRTAAYIPAYGVVGWAYETLPEDALPKEIVQATCEAAIRELAEPGSLAPDLAQGGGIVNVQAGSASVTWAGGGFSEAKTFTVIENILGAILPAVNPYSGSTGRG